MSRYRKFVLLVDDSLTDLYFFKRLLEKAEFKVIATSDPNIAMSMIVAGEVGCLVTDQTMPITGQELVAHVRGVRSDIGVIFLSGAKNPRDELTPGAIFVQKDNKQQLLEAITPCMVKFRTA